jgi:hypothetical protein
MRPIRPIRTASFGDRPNHCRYGSSLDQQAHSRRKDKGRKSVNSHAGCLKMLDARRHSPVRDQYRTEARPVGESEYSVVVLRATGNVSGRIVLLLIKNPLCKKLVVVTRRKTDAFAAPKVFDVVVNMTDSKKRFRPTSGESTSRWPRWVSARAGEDARGGRSQDRNRLAGGILPRCQGWRRSCVGGHDSSRRGPRRRDEIRQDHR